MARSGGTPLARIQRIAGQDAEARMSAMISGIVTIVSVRMSQMIAPVTTTTRMICRQRMARLPKASAHRLHGLRVATGAIDAESSLTMVGESFRNRPMQRR